jgi:hypothetical protein
VLTWLRFFFFCHDAPEIRRGRAGNVSSGSWAARAVRGAGVAWRGWCALELCLLRPCSSNSWL